MRPDAEPISNAIAIYQAHEGTYLRLNAAPQEGCETLKNGCRVRMYLNPVDFFSSHLNGNLPKDTLLVAITVQSAKPSSEEKHYFSINTQDQISVLESYRLEVGQPRKPLTPTLEYLLRRINQAKGSPIVISSR